MCLTPCSALWPTFPGPLCLAVPWAGSPGCVQGPATQQVQEGTRHLSSRPPPSTPRATVRRRAGRGPQRHSDSDEPRGSLPKDVKTSTEDRTKHYTWLLPGTRNERTDRAAEAWGPHGEGAPGGAAGPFLPPSVCSSGAGGRGKVETKRPRTPQPLKPEGTVRTRPVFPSDRLTRTSPPGLHRASRPGIETLPASVPQASPARRQERPAEPGLTCSVEKGQRLSRPHLRWPRVEDGDGALRLLTHVGDEP